MRNTFFVILALFIVSCSQEPTKGEIELALNELDAVLDNRHEIETAKNARIDSLYHSLGKVNDEREQYRLYDALFDEYFKWDIDSALFYAHSKFELALKLNDHGLQYDSHIDLAERYVLSGMYQNALDVMESTETDLSEHSSDYKEREALLYMRIYHGLTRVTNDEQISKKHHELELKHLKFCEETLPKNSLDYHITRANIEISEGKTSDARKRLLTLINEKKLSKPDAAITHYWIAKSYSADKDLANAIVHYAKSAKYDIEIPIREYRSLILLAKILYERGEIDRAYRYITIANNDNIIADSRISIFEIENSVVTIATAYEQKNVAQKAKLITSIIALFILLIVVLFAFIALNRNRKRLYKAKIEIEEQSWKLKESNHIKDSCMGEFLSMFTGNIDSLERYRSRLRKLIKQQDINLIQHELRSEDYIEEEAKLFYDRFDKFFLKLFPNFIEQFNELLEPDKRVGMRLEPGKLTNELRIFALMRLGVEEPAKVAKFLRRSPSTIYNYRIKMRNAAIGNRDDFEKNVMKIS